MEKRVSFSTEVTVVRAWACRSRRRCLSHERRRLTTRCMSTTCHLRRSLSSIAVRATCVATVAREALVVSTITRGDKQVSFPAEEDTVVRMCACHLGWRRLSVERRRLTIRCMSTTCHSRCSLVSVVVRATCVATVARDALVVSTITRGDKQVPLSAEEDTVVRACSCHLGWRRLSVERRRLTTRCMSTTCHSRCALVSVVVRATCVATVARGALVVSTITRGNKRGSFSTHVTVVCACACRLS